MTHITVGNDFIAKHFLQARGHIRHLDGFAFTACGRQWAGDGMSSVGDGHFFTICNPLQNSSQIVIYVRLCRNYNSNAQYSANHILQSKE